MERDSVRVWVLVDNCNDQRFGTSLKSGVQMRTGVGW